MDQHEAWHLSTTAAERYGRYVASSILGPRAPLLVDAARVAMGERVLDIACGTGAPALRSCCASKAFSSSPIRRSRCGRRAVSITDGGRLALSVWNSVGVYNGAVGDALTRYLGHEVALQFCASRRAPGKEELQRLALEAGFTAVHVGVRQLNVRLPRLDIFALDHFPRNTGRIQNRSRQH